MRIESGDTAYKTLIRQSSDDFLVENDLNFKLNLYT